MNKCRCGHGRQWHRATANAISKRRRRGIRTPARASCHALVMVMRPGFTTSAYTVAPRQVQDECKCRDWHPQEVER